MNSKYWMCPVCNKRAGSGTFVCTGCQPEQWVHLKCGGYTAKSIKLVSDSTLLKCNNCKGKVPAQQEVSCAVTKNDHLYTNKTKVFLAELIADDCTQPCSTQRLLPEGHASFRLKTIYIRSAISWDGFDRKNHVIGSTVVWDMQYAKERILPRPTSEATNSNGANEVERGRARWRQQNVSQWKSTIRHEKRVRGESYSPQKRRGSITKTQKKSKSSAPRLRRHLSAKMHFLARRV